MRFKYLVNSVSSLDVELIEGLEGHKPSDYDDIELIQNNYYEEEEGYLDLMLATNHKDNTRVYYLGKYVFEF